MNNTNIARIYISAIKKSSGKTTIALALNRIISNMGFTVQPFKKGPDFIDPMWHTQATKRVCRNLDFFFMSHKEITGYFAEKSKGADLAIIEGNHGLFDDIRTEGGNDNASMAKLLDTPVILVIDVKEMGRSIVPIILGCKDFDKELDIAGVILNRVQSLRQEKRLKSAINFYTNTPILGSIPDNENIAILQRHLGLSATMNEFEKEEIISKIASYIENFIDTDNLLKLAKQAKPIKIENPPAKNIEEQYNVTIGVAYDTAFNFYYEDNFETFKNHGCTIKFFSPINDEKLPDVDALYIGGGFPELFSAKLEENSSIRKEIKIFSDNNMPIYAECGGLIYLTNNIIFNDKKHKMASVIDVDSIFHKKPIGHGYTIIEPSSRNSGWWSKLGSIKGHEFHHASLSGLGKIRNCAFRIKKGFGVNGECDGIIVNNTLASFTHLYSPSSDFFEEWIRFIASTK